mgnify:CR=1 FL=1
MNLLIAQLVVFYGLILFLAVAYLKDYFKYKKLKIDWQGKEKTIYYFIKEDLSPGGTRMDCYVTDSWLLYLTMFSYVRISLDSGRVEYVHIRISGLRSVIEKSWIRDLILKLPKKLDPLVAIKVLEKPNPDFTSWQRDSAFKDLTYPENRAFQKIVDQLPEVLNSRAPSEIIKSLPENKSAR